MRRIATSTGRLAMSVSTCMRAAAVAGAIGLAGCSGLRPAASVKPAGNDERSYAVLLANGDGTAGSLRIEGGAGRTSVDQPRLAVPLDGSPPSVVPVDEATLHADFAAAVAASPRRPVTFRLYFNARGAVLNAPSEAALPRIAEELSKRAAPDISVVGHTDTAGDAVRNQALGLGRARMVADLIIKGGGITADRVVVESWGERRLLVQTADNVAEARNRRVEVTIR